MEINKEEKTEKMNKKKRRLTVLFCILGILLMLVLGFFAGRIIYNVMDEKGELENVDVNKILSREETQGDDENIMNVTLETPVPTAEPTPEPTKAPNSNTTTTQNQKEILYYIKINNSANVVTVYKKDSERKFYSAI